MTNRNRERDQEIRTTLIDIGRMLWENGLIAGTCGNITARLDQNLVLSTPTGLAKGRLTPDDLVVTDLQGHVVSGRLQPSSELKIHLAAYRLRPEIGAIVHAHPKTVVAHSLASLTLLSTVLPETVITLGPVPVVPYETPGTSRLAARIESVLSNHNAIIMERHGAVTLGRDLFQAYERIETLEHAAQTLYLAQTMGHVEPLSDDEIIRLLQLGTGGVTGEV